MSYVIGLDYSLTSPGITIKTPEGKLKFYFLAHKPKLEGIQFDNEDFRIEGVTYPIYSSDQERYEKLAYTVLLLLEINQASKESTRIFIEGYSYASSVSSMFPLAENMSILKYFLWKEGYSFEMIPPSKVKKLATDKGNAKKEDVYHAFKSETGLDLINILGLKSEKIGNPVSDIADSYWLSRFGDV